MCGTFFCSAFGDSPPSRVFVASVRIPAGVRFRVIATRKANDRPHAKRGPPSSRSSSSYLALFFFLFVDSRSIEFCEEIKSKKSTTISFEMRTFLTTSSCICKFPLPREPFRRLLSNGGGGGGGPLSGKPPGIPRVPSTQIEFPLVRFPQ